MTISFRANEDKTLEALVWIAEQRPGIDVFHVCKTLYFADKLHLNKYGRPITGDRYVAMADGPVPSLAYAMAGLDSQRLPNHLLEKASIALLRDSSDPVGQGYLILNARREPNLAVFSQSDVECLKIALNNCANLTFKQLWDLVHQEPGYNEVYQEGVPPRTIGYERIIDRDRPDADQIRRELEELSREAVL